MKWFLLAVAILLIGLGGVLFVVLAQMFIASHANAHDWYDSGCCYGSHCRPAHPGEIQEIRGGYWIPRAAEFIPYGDPRIHISKDGDWHRCTADQKEENPTICIYIPATS